jgi:hypothetical protein
MEQIHSNQFLENLIWHDAKIFTIAGKSWVDESRTYERFPIRAESKIPVKPWSKSQASAGVSIHFISDTQQLYARWLDYNDEWAINQLSADQVTLYVYDSGRWRWLATSKQIANTHIYQLIGESIPKFERSYMLYLPLGRGVRKLELGISHYSLIKPAPPRLEKPIVFYGTSIIHGLTASRPGNHLTGKLERHFNYPFINLGVSGSARMEESVIGLVAEIDALIYVIDCLPNMDAKGIRSNFVPAIMQLRKTRPTVPIFIVESITYQQSFLVKELFDRFTQSNKALSEGFEFLLKQGFTNLHYVQGDQLLQEDDTHDGTHPNDQGFQRMANCFIKLLEPYIKI